MSEIMNAKEELERFWESVRIRRIINAIKEEGGFMDDEE